MTTKEMIEVMQAYEDGKVIQCKTKYTDDWRDMVCEPVWSWNTTEYRIKSEPKYVPYDSVAEVDKDKWFKDKSNGMLYRMTQIDPSDNTVSLIEGWESLKALFERYTYEDGTPCGKLVEE